MRKIFSLGTLVMTAVFFALFMVIGCGAYYVQAGELVSAERAMVYAALGLAGALGVCLRFYWFAVFFYAGCAGGLLAGQFVGGLEGAFASAAANFSTVFVLALFTLIGTGLEVGRQKRLFRRHAEEKKAEREAGQARKKALLEEREQGQPTVPAEAAQAPEPAAVPPEGQGPAGGDRTL